MAAALLSVALSLALSMESLIPQCSCHSLPSPPTPRVAPPSLNAGEETGSAYGGFVLELRRAKAALLLALRSEQPQGALDADMQAMIDALANVNPSDPDPAADIDLWGGGKFELVSAPLAALSASAIAQLPGASLEISDVGRASLMLQLVLGDQTAQLQASLTPMFSHVCRTVLFPLLSPPFHPPFSRIGRGRCVCRGTVGSTMVAV